MCPRLYVDMLPFLMISVNPAGNPCKIYRFWQFAIRFLEIAALPLVARKDEKDE